MIFVSVGTQLPFDRLIKAVDAWAEEHPDTEVFAQIGTSDFQPRHMKWATHLDAAVFCEKFSTCEVVVSHAGTGNILLALELEKSIILLPRCAALHEHRNDHQLATLAHLKDRAGIYAVKNENEIGMAIEKVRQEKLACVKISPYASPELLDTIRRFINEA
jgi:UDP-N-acetylglucosamine transferase subunit ALG13